MQTLELVQLIIEDSKRGSAGATIAKLELVEHILAGTSSYMHSDIVRAAFEDRKPAPDEEGGNG